MDFRTDLALERCEFLGKKETKGIEIEEFDTPEYRKNKQYYMAMDEAKNFISFLGKLKL